MLKAEATVRSKNPKAAVKVPGRVMGAYPGDRYAAIMTAYGLDMAPWDEAFPDWKTKPVYAVFFDMPFKTCTPEQWVDHAVKKGYKAEAAMNDYGQQCPEIQTMCFPADDPEEVNNNEMGNNA